LNNYTIIERVKERLYIKNKEIMDCEELDAMLNSKRLDEIICWTLEEVFNDLK